MASVALGCAAGQLVPIGLSMGGLVALEMWRQAPERVNALALFDIDPAADTPEKLAGRTELLAGMRKVGMEAVLRQQLVPRYFAAGANACADTSAFEIAVDMALAQGISAYVAQHAALSSRQDYSTLLKHIDVPTLVACGDDDGICPLALHQRVAATIATARLVQIHCGGHLPSLAKPDETTEVLSGWLSEAVLHDSVANMQH